MGRCAQKRPVKSKSVRENKSWSKGSKRAGSGTQTNRILRLRAKKCLNDAFEYLGFVIMRNGFSGARQTENVNGERQKTLTGND